MVDVSNCKYLTTSTNPYKYYWSFITSSMKSMVKPEKFENACAVRKKEFNIALNDEQLTENTPQTYALLASYVAHYVFMDAVKTADKETYSSFALEYYRFDPDNMMSNFSKRPQINEYEGFFIEKRNALKQLVRFQPLVNKLLTTTNLNSTIVIDFDAFRDALKRKIRKYYADNPEMRDNMLPDDNLKAEVASVFNALGKELTSKALEQYTNGKNKQNYDKWSF